MLPSTGTVGDSYDNAMAESVNGAYKTELVWRRKPPHYKSGTKIRPYHRIACLKSY